MSKIVMKGGVWKNTEDEILKVAVMKYGKNQWARISSLLVRKTPKQCKARWFEWIDPDIKKTEWSKEEEEKLLHLAKIMPTQWRTIAPLVGRTPAQCLEHYEKLLDVAQGDVGASEEAKKLRPGEVDPDPETKPARPDPVDMDEDEKEMLSEARARLANTQGKKAKRKAREKQLQEARRLASIQKRREMKAAGIFVRSFKKRKRDMNYNTEVPLEKRAPAGFFDVSGEKEKDKDPSFKRVPNLSKAIHGERRSEMEAEARRRDIQKDKERKDKGIPANIAKLLKEQEESEAEELAKRPKLMLPTPQVNDQELDQIVKIGMQGESARAAVDFSLETPSRALLSDYNNIVATPMRTPRMPGTSSDEYLKMQAQNILALTQTQTPLKGGENTPLQGQVSDSFAGMMTPKRQVAATPNALLGSLATPLRKMLDTPQRTPSAHGSSSASGPGATPFRDQLNLNQQKQSVSNEELMHQQAMIRDSIKRAFLSLPPPQNDFEIVLDEDEEDETEKMDLDDKEDDGGKRTSSSKIMVGEDQSEVEERARQLLAQEEEKRLSKRSTAIKRSLPRPLTFPKAYHAVSKAEEDEIRAMIQSGVIERIRHDAVKYPVPGSDLRSFSLVKSSAAEYDDSFDQLEFNDPETYEKYIKEATDLLERETAPSLESNNFESFCQIHEEIYQEWKEKSLYYSVKEGRWIEGKKSDALDALKHEYSILTRVVKDEAKRANELEEKLMKPEALGDLVDNQIPSLKVEFERISNLLSKATIDANSFERLAQQEKIGLKVRLEGLQDQVTKLSGLEMQLQEEYAEAYRKYQQRN